MDTRGGSWVVAPRRDLAVTHTAEGTMGDGAPPWAALGTHCPVYKCWSHVSSGCGTRTYGWLPTRKSPAAWRCIFSDSTAQANMVLGALLWEQTSKEAVQHPPWEEWELLLPFHAPSGSVTQWSAQPDTATSQAASLCSTYDRLTFCLRRCRCLTKKPTKLKASSLPHQLIPLFLSSVRAQQPLTQTSPSSSSGHPAQPSLDRHMYPKAARAQQSHCDGAGLGP